MTIESFSIIFFNYTSNAIRPYSAILRPISSFILHTIIKFRQKILINSSFKLRNIDKITQKLLSQHSFFLEYRHFHTRPDMHYRKCLYDVWFSSIYNFIRFPMTEGRNMDTHFIENYFSGYLTLKMSA